MPRAIRSPLGDAVRDEIHDRAHPQQRHGTPARRACGAQPIREDVLHVAAEPVTERPRQRAQNPPVNDQRARSHFLPFASATTASRRAISAAATRRPSAVMR